MALISTVCEKQSFRNDGLEDLDTISMIDVYEHLIHAAIQQKVSPSYCIIKLTFREKHEPRSIYFFRI